MKTISAVRITLVLAPVLSMLCMFAFSARSQTGRTSDARTASAISALDPNPALPTPLVRADFNGDGTSDIIWQHPSGARAIWLMNGPSFGSSVSLGTVDPTWEIRGSSDFNGDVKPDILWQNALTGERVIWLMNGTIHTNSVSLGIVGTSWDIVGAGDFNEDGESDILWQNKRTGVREFAIWIMNGTTRAISVHLRTLNNQNWEIAGAGNFSEPGGVDILLQNRLTGERVIWLMDATRFNRGVYLRTVPTEWEIGGTGDFNSDGEVDILWKNTSTGVCAVWLMNGTSFASSVALGFVGTSWEIENH